MPHAAARASGRGAFPGRLDVKMMCRLTRLTAVVLAGVAAACSNNSPSSPTGSGATASVTVPRPSLPSANASVRFADQPVTLAVQNAVTTGSGVVYTFEVASDASFASKLQTKDNVSEGSGGQTTVKLDPLAGGQDYFWRARATAGGTAGPYSAVAKFTVGPAIIVNPPSPIGPLNGTTTPPRPVLRVTNATRSGGAGAVSYHFEVANSAAFTNLLASTSVPEGINETGYIPPTDLPVNVTLFWRATAIDTASGVSSTPSAVQSFTIRPFSQAERIAAQLNTPLWPGTQPAGNFGHATMGDDPVYGQGWQVQTLHYLPQNVFFQSPDIEMLRFFDLFDRGYDPDSAIAWMNGNGYHSEAVWYPGPEKAVLGLRYVYIAARGKVVSNGIWDVVLRVE
jgi:hypothetical protein